MEKHIVKFYGGEFEFVGSRGEWIGDFCGVQIIVHRLMDGRFVAWGDGCCNWGHTMQQAAGGVMLEIDASWEYDAYCERLAAR